MLISQVIKSSVEKVMKNLLWILLLTLLFTPVHSQKIPFSNFTVQNGLPQNKVNDIVQDTTGYIWFATEVGVARYDGYEFEFFNNTDGLLHNLVHCMLVDRHGKVWFGTEGGVNVFDGNIFKSYTVTDGLEDNRIDRIIEDPEGNIWAASIYGLSIITADSIITYAKGDALTDNSIMEMFVDSRGRVHVATYPNPGLTIFENPYSFRKFKEDEIIWDIVEDLNGDIWYATQGIGIRINSGEGSYWLTTEEGLSDETVLSLMVDHRGRVWCGTYFEGIQVYDNGKFSPVKMGNDQKPVVKEFLEDRNHRIWIRTFGEGVWLSEEEGEFRLLTTRNGLVHDEINDFMEDGYGNIWVATAGGASKYGRVIFEFTDTEMGLPDNHVSALLLDSKQRLWCGTYNNLLYRDRMGIHILDEGNGFPINVTPYSFAEDKKGNIYIGSNLGLWYFNGRFIEPVVFNRDDTLSRVFFSLLLNDDNRLWCATDSGLIILENGKIIPPGGMDEGSRCRFNDLEKAGDRIYAAMECGLSVYDTKGNFLSAYTMEDSLSSNVCLDLTTDFQGNLWVATDQGLSKITIGKDLEIEKFGTEYGLVSNTTYFVEFSDSCYLWIGTERGLYRLDIIGGDTKYYGYNDGFFALETNARAVARGKDGDLWIGTMAGLVHYLPEYDRIDLKPPALILKPPIVDGDPYIPEPELANRIPVFPYNRNSLEFVFTGIHTTIPEKNRFSYFLEGFDDLWSSPGSDRTASYKKLPSGNYVFRVRAFNLDGVATDEEASFSFSVKPPFWRTIWFILFEIIAGLGIIFGITKYRERQLVREKRILEVKVKERTQEIEDQKVEIEAQRDEIVGKNKEITDSIHYARRIQHAVLPGKQTLERVLPGHFIFFKPRDIVSGDFYWVEQKNDRVIVCAADCTGHGVPGAFMSMLGLTFLNEIVNKDEVLKASEILDRLRSYIINALSHTDSQTMDGMDISLVVLDRQLNIMEYAGAYNPLLIVREGELTEYKADKMPVGKHVGEVGPFSNNRIPLQNGDVFYLFSDGFPDQFGGEEGGKFKSRPFRRLLQSISSESMERQQELLEMELKEWMRDYDQVDDILVIGIRYE
jgi:ligand-binding sensor domain-containing protein/serine phosphatase RsbU (regulator of sigma subunit)